MNVLLGLLASARIAWDRASPRHRGMLVLLAYTVIAAWLVVAAAGLTLAFVSWLR